MRERAMLAQFVMASFQFATPGSTCRSWCSLCLYSPVCNDECSSRPRHLALLQDLIAGEPGPLCNLQEALQVMLISVPRSPCVHAADLGLAGSLLTIVAFQTVSQVGRDTMVTPHSPCPSA